MKLNISLPVVLVVALGLISCGEVTATAEPPTQELQPLANADDRLGAGARIAIALDSEGLRLVDTETGSTRLLAFGTDRAAAEKIIAAKLGAIGSRSSNQECGAGPMDFSEFGALTVNFQDGRFVGWSLRDGDASEVLTTISGIGPGTTRAEMAETVEFEIYEDSSLGTEFYTGGDGVDGYSGLFESEAGDARITDLWAGANCIFR